MSVHKIYNRRDKSEWTSLNTVLAQGEPGFEKDTGRYKIGNGITAWNSLEYGNPIPGVNIDIFLDIIYNINEYANYVIVKDVATNYTATGDTLEERMVGIDNKLGSMSSSANLVTSISGSSTDVQYPSAKLLYDQLLLKANLAGHSDITGLYDFTNGELVLPNDTPLNAVAAGAPMVVVARPASYIKDSVAPFREYTVATQPNVNVFSSLTTALVGNNNDLVFTSKTLGVAGDAIEIEYIDPGAEGALGISVVGTVIEITLANSAVPAITTTAAQIKALIEGTPAAHALVGITYPALNDGSGIVTVLVQTPLAGGQNADTLVIGVETYTFLANGSTPAALSIVLGTTVTLTNSAIVALGGLTNVIVSAGSTVTKFLITHKVVSAVNNGYVVTPDGTRITGTANLAGGVTAVRNYITVGSKFYTFTTTGDGTDPATDYPGSVRVDSANGEADMSAIATVLAAAIDTDALWVVSRDTATVTVNCLVKGAGNVGAGTGNFTKFENHLATAGNVTSANFATGLMTSGVDGTPGYIGQVYCSAVNMYVCNSNDYSVTNTGWTVKPLVYTAVPAVGLNAENDTNKITAIIAALRTRGILGPNA